MTNEEFEAEVFRRSRAYMQQRQKQRRILSGAAAFACCAVIAGTGVLLRTRGSKNEMMNSSFTITADQAETDGAMLENSEEYGDEMNEEYAEAAEEAEMYGASDFAENAEGVSGGQQRGQHESPAAEPKYAAHRSLAELCAQFGIPVPPETLAGFVRYETDESNIDTDNCAFLRYENADGSRLTIEICTRGAGDPEDIRYDIVIVGGRSALFGAGDARIIMWVNDDAPDADGLIHAAAEELKEDLVQ